MSTEFIKELVRSVSSWIALVAIVVFSLIAIVGTDYFAIRHVITESMEPAIEKDSIVVIKKCDIDSIKENDIICFKYGDNDIIHRVMSIDKNKEIQTKGDNNKRNDDILVSSDMLVGVVIWHAKISDITRVILGAIFVVFILAVSFINGGKK